MINCYLKYALSLPIVIQQDSSEWTRCLLNLIGNEIIGKAAEIIVYDSNNDTATEMLSNLNQSLEPCTSVHIYLDIADPSQETDVLSWETSNRLLHGDAIIDSVISLGSLNPTISLYLTEPR